MSWSYNPALGSDIDRVRFWCGDTNENSQLVTDEEIAYILSVQPIVKLAAADVCEAIASRASTVTSRSIGGTSVSQDARGHFTMMAERLRTQYRQQPVPLFQGGQTESDKDTYRTNQDLVQPFFERMQDDDEDTLPNDTDRIYFRHRG